MALLLLFTWFLPALAGLTLLFAIVTLVALLVGLRRDRVAVFGGYAVMGLGVALLLALLN